MIGYSKSQQIGRAVGLKKRKADGSTLSKTKEWENERAKLKLVYASHGITKCEYLSQDGRGCYSQNYLSFAHRNKRRNLEPGDLGDINETLLLCLDHHQLIENDKDETDRLFSILRPI